MSTPSDSTTGRLVAGRYLLREPLGRGGMGVVWAAEDTVLGRDVAVKEVLFPPYISDEERAVLRERTLREARLAARLSHPAAVTVYDVVEEGGQPFLVMEFVRARTLSEIIRADGPLPPVTVARIGLEVLGALEAAHEVGIVHRDVKPGNVMVRPDGRATLADFGIATSTEDASITSTGLLLGSPSYISPERARGARPGPPSDLWSLGATLYAAVEGRPPFDRGEALPTLTAVVSEPHEDFLAAGPLAPVLDGLLDKDPETRWTADQARAGLERVVRSNAPTPPAQPAVAPARGASRGARTQALPVQGLPPAVDAPATPRPPVRMPPRRPPGATPPPRQRSLVPLMVAAFVLVALLSGLAMLILDGGGDDDGGTAQPSPSATATESGPDGPTDIEGWETFTGPEGWSVQHPPGWTERAGTGGTIDLVDPEGGRYLRIDTQSPANPAGAKGAWEAQEPSVQQRFGASYQRISIEEVDFRDYDGTADWEFRFEDQGAQLHVRNRGLTVGDRGYALYFQTHEDKWDESQDLWRDLMRSFRPA